MKKQVKRLKTGFEINTTATAPPDMIQSHFKALVESLNNCGNRTHLRSGQRTCCFKMTIVLFSSQKVYNVLEGR